MKDNCIEITGNIGKLNITVNLEFTVNDPEGISANLSVRSKEITLDIGCYFSGYNISQFVDELSGVKRNINGCATLITLNEEAAIPRVSHLASNESQDASVSRLFAR